MGTFDTSGKILFAQAGGNQQGALELAAAVNIDGDMVFLETVAAQCEGKMAFPASGAGNHLTAQFLQGIQQRGHGTPAHLFRGVHMVYALGKSQKGSEKAGCRSRAAHILGRFRERDESALSLNGDLAAGFILRYLEPQILNAF